MSDWSKTNKADLVTWMTEMAITDLQLSFADSPALTMKELTSHVPGASGGMNDVSISAHMQEFFRMMLIYNPSWKSGVTPTDGQATIRAVMADGDKTMADLSEAVDSVLDIGGNLPGV